MNLSLVTQRQDAAPKPFWGNSQRGKPNPTWRTRKLGRWGMQNGRKD